MLSPPSATSGAAHLSLILRLMYALCRIGLLGAVGARTRQGDDADQAEYVRAGEPNSARPCATEQLARLVAYRLPFPVELHSFSVSAHSSVYSRLLTCHLEDEQMELGYAMFVCLFAGGEGLPLWVVVRSACSHSIGCILFHGHVPH